MNGFLVFLWFVVGLLGYNVGKRISLAEGVEEEPEWAWVSLLGPFVLLVVLVDAVQKATQKSR